MVAAWELDGMRRAIVLSAFGLGTTSPNPPVGCVVFDAAGRRIGEGYHERKGEAHAETRALAVAGAAADGGTAVVTLEPCNHSGRTPPCRKALIDAGIARVVIAVLDPTSRGEGGAAELRKAGVSVEVGVCEQEARLVLDPWLASLRAGRPTVTWAYRVATHPGNTRGPHIDAPDVLDIDDLRAGRDVVVYGDGRTAEGRPGSHGSAVFTLPGGPLPADPHTVLADLAAGGARTVLLAGGQDLAEPYLMAGLVDEIAVHFAVVPVVETLEGHADPPFGVPPGFGIAHVARAPGGLRLSARKTPMSAS